MTVPDPNTDPDLLIPMMHRAIAERMLAIFRILLRTHDLPDLDDEHKLVLLRQLTDQAVVHLEKNLGPTQ